MNSNRKGKDGEREAADAIREVWGIEARRGQQFKGGPDSPDVLVDGIHVEVKRTERLELWTALEQAAEESGLQPYCVLHRSNRHPWVVIVPLTEFQALARAVCVAQAKVSQQAKPG